MDNLYITQSDVEIYNHLIEVDGRNGAPTLRNKFNEIIKKYREINGDPPEKVYFVEFWDNFVSYTIEYEMYCTNEYISLNLLKNPDWESVLKEQFQKEKIQNQTSEIKQKIDQYSKIKDKAIEIAKEYALLKCIRKSNIEDGIFTFMTSPSDIEKEIVTVLFELRSIAGELDDQEIFIFPMELLVIDNWKEKLKEYHNSETEFNRISIRR